MANSLDARMSPEEATAAAKKAVEQASQPDNRPPPIPARPPELTTTLPGGLQDLERGLISTATLRELTGEHEERLSHASTNMRFKHTLLECGVALLGDEKPSAEMLRSLFVGDREHLVLQIRIASFGPEVDTIATCNECGNVMQVSLDLESIDSKSIDANTVMRVPLSGNRTAIVRPATGEEEEKADEVLSNGGTTVEANTTTLATCILDIEGDPNPWFPVPESARRLSIRDRRAILEKMSDSQPGPQFDNIKTECSECGADAAVILTLVSLFR